MATTIQTQQPTTPNPQLKRLVYSKYREMLGSYNDKANTIIQSLPTYMVKEDKGFHFDCIDDLTRNVNGNNHDYVDCNDSKRYGAPQAPSSMSGSIPSQRLPTQCTPNNPPACVQNAMMTKDKKPFTYTPSGIDLSQIKSDRMAKRLARNAQMEGVGTNPKQNPYAQQALQQQQHSPGLAQSALGMPVQVFPTGPPPPPPPQPKCKTGGPGGVPPPPPPQPSSKNQLAPQGNGAAARKSPSPQNFEPPPFGCRPEIKIPPNPMAALKKVPKPVEKNDFWIEEYRKDRSKSPMLDSAPQGYAYQPQDNYDSKQNQNNSPSPPPAVIQQQQPSAPIPMRSPAISQYQQPQQQQSTLRSPALNQTQLYDQNRGQSPLKSPAVNQTQLYDQNRGQSPIRSPAIQQTQQYDQNRGQSPMKSPAIAQIQSQYQQQTRQQSPIRTFPGGQIQQNRIESPFQSPQDNPNLQRPLSPVRVNPQQQTPTYTRSPPEQQQTPRNAVGSLYIPPVAPENLATKQQQSQILSNQQQQLQQQQLQQQQLQQQQQEKADRKGPAPNRWISAQPSKDVPDWARQNDTTKQQSPQMTRPQQVTQQSQSSPPIRNNVSSPGQQQQQPKLNHMNPGLRLQMTNNVQSPGSAPREHIIPIQLEQTPTPTRSPATPGFGPQPYQNSNQQFSSVSSPSGGNSPGYVIRNPNQFVDQGYNNYGQQQSPGQQSGGTGSRVVPVKIEGQDSPFNANNVRGPLSQSPMVMQNGHYNLIVHDIPLEAEIRYRKARLSDPRTLQHQNSWGNNGSGPNGPNQSKSFRILQKITDTEGSDDNLSPSSSNAAVTATSTNNKQINDNNYDQSSAQLQRPQYSRQMSSSSSSGIGNGVNNHNNHQQQYIDNQTEQMRRMQISNNDQDYMNRSRNHVDEANPSTITDELKSRVTLIPQDQIHILHDMLDRKLKEEGLNVGGDSDTATFIKDIQNNGTPPVMRQQQPPRYLQQRPYQFNEDQYQQYVHPSEQQVPEPKIYTGSAIPSRSFKLLQAMTTPENAAEMEGSGVVDYEQISNIPYPPYPYPYGYPYPPPYPYPPIDPNNWSYPHPPPLPYPPVPPYFYYYPEYDSQNYYIDPYSNESVFQRPRSLSQDRFRDYRRDTRRDSAPPNIIITPTFDEREENRFDEDEQRIAEQTRNVRAKSSLDSISERLNKINNRDYLELNISREKDKTYVGESQKRVANTPSPNYSSSPNSISAVTNERSVIENNDIHTKNGEGDYSSSEDENEEFDEVKPLENFWGNSDQTDLKRVENDISSDNDHAERKQNYRKAIDFFRTQTNSVDILISANDTIISETDNTNKQENARQEIYDSTEEEENTEESDSESEKVEKGDFKLQAIKSVQNIQMYNENDEETTIEDGSKIFDGDDTEIEEELTDDETEIVEESPDEESDNDEDIEELIVQDNLSVIYEESEGGASNGIIKRRNAESLSEASTTIGNDKEEESDDELTDNKKQDENSVTVRLPLRLSFSKTSNDENITTVEVGRSEIEDQTKSFSIASVNETDDEEDYSDDPNVSVTLSLSSSPSESFDKPENFRKSFSIEEIKDENKSDDDDVSVSFSLSMRNKFLHETFGSDFTNDIAVDTERKEVHDMKKWERDFADDEEQDKENEEGKRKMQDDEISLLLSPSYKNIWQSFGTTLKDIATKEDPVESSEITNNADVVTNCSNSGDDVEDFWANIKESRKREPTPDFWTTLKENKDEIIIEPIDEDHEIVESIHDSDDGSNSADENKEGTLTPNNDFLSSIEKSKRAIEEIKNGFDNFWGSRKATEDINHKNKAAVNEFGSSRHQENCATDANLKNNSTNEEVYNEDVDDYWGSEDNDGNESDNSEQKRKNYKKAMEFFTNKKETSLPIKKTEDLVRSEESKEQFQNIWKTFGSAAKEQNLENFNQRTGWTETNSNNNIADNQYEEEYEEEEAVTDEGESEEEVTEEEETEEEETEEEETEEEVEEQEQYSEEHKVIQDIACNNVNKHIILNEILEREKFEEADTEEEEEEEEYEEDDMEEAPTDLVQKSMDTNEDRTQQRFISNATYTSKPSNMCPTYYSPPIYQHENSPFIFNDSKRSKTETYTDSIDKSEIEQTRSVRDKIMAFETGSIDNSDSKLKVPFAAQCITENVKDNISRTSSLQRSESELEEDDSGVTDMSKHISETDTESECFPELRKMTSYQRAATHSRLFKLLQEESDGNESGNADSGKPNEVEERSLAEDFNFKPSRKKIIHNVSITRRNNPDAVKDAESMSQRRQRLSLPLQASNSIDSDNLSSSNSPTNSNSNSRHNVSDQLVTELVQSLLLKNNTSHLKNLPMEKLKAAAKRVLEEDMDSLENTSLESTPALTPQEFKTDSYSEYYDTWDTNISATGSTLNEDFEIVPSKSLKILQEQSVSGKRKPWGVRCPRVLSSKTINRDLTRVSESPENFRASSMIRSSTERESDHCYSRANSITKRKL